jgi:hypothetical protein
MTDAGSYALDPDNYAIEEVAIKPSNAADFCSRKILSA